MVPKVFISYSWSSPGHQSLIRQWAEQLIADGIDVVIDIFDLKEGNDKYDFMERMVKDPTVTHVLMFCDKSYAEKADARIAGVGTESQIISKEIYDNVGQSKFIPIACEFSDDDNPFLPTFLQSRIWLNFSSPEAVNDNWERLIRLIYGKPEHEKPKLGKPPSYITSNTATPSNPAINKFNAFRQALLQDKKGLSFYREEFLTACFNFADGLRVREPPVDSLGKKILEDCGKLKPIRNLIVDWVLLESEISPTEVFCNALLDFLEKLRELKSRPPEINSWQESWFEAHTLFVYETFLYIIAALLKTNSFQTLHEVFTTHYLLPSTERHGFDRFETFHCFYGYSDALQSELAPPGKRLNSPAAELIKRQADRVDLPFTSIIEAELLILLMAFLNPTVGWYPQTLYYHSYNREFPFFVRATQHKHFLKLTSITGISDVEQMRREVRAGHERLNVKQWGGFSHVGSFWSYMNMDGLDTIK